MDKNKYDEELEFTQGLYDEAEEQIKEVYKEQKKNRDNILQELALIMLTYTVLDGLMSLTSKDKKKEYKRLSNVIKTNYKATGEIQNGVVTDILTKTINNTFDFYSYNAELKDVQAIIDKSFKGKHFSDRVWENEKETAKHLHKQVNDFLNGKVNVNQIKRNIEKTYNTSAYNAKRLVETEVARVENDSFKRFCNEAGVKKVRRNAVLDNRTCNDCSSFDGKVYDLKDAPDLPAHPLCRCFYEIADENYILNEKIATDSKEYNFDYTPSKSSVEWNRYIDVDEGISNTLNDIHTDLNKYMLENKKEKLSLLRISDNNILIDQVGEINGIKLSKDTVKLLKRTNDNDIIFAHSHPSKTTFSMDDIKKIIDFNSIKALTVECSNGSKYVLQRENNISILKKINFEMKYRNIYWKVANKYPELNDEVKIYDVWDKFLDEVTKEVSKEYGLMYKEVKL